MANTLFPVTQLDHEQTLTHSYDETVQGFRTSTSVTISGDVAVEIDAADGDNISLASPDGSQQVTVTTIGPKEALDVNIAGGTVTATFNPSGLNGPISTSVFPVTDVPALVPLSLANGQTVSIRVWGNSTVYFGETALIGTNGYPKLRYEDFILDIKSGNSVYATCAAGQVSELRIMQLAS